MCLTIPKRVISVKNGVVRVKSGNGAEEAGTIIKIKKGDWVLTQNDVIIKKISQAQVREINKLLRNTK